MRQAKRGVSCRGGMLHQVSEVKEMILSGQDLVLAGSEEALSQLPKGNWIGGSIPYFIDQEGGVCDEERIFVSRLPEYIVGLTISTYSEDSLPLLYSHAPTNGFTILLLPYGTDVHHTFAERAPNYEGYLFKPVFGWVTGVLLSKAAEKKPCVFHGKTGRKSYEDAIGMHVRLPEKMFAEIVATNIFSPMRDSIIHFPRRGFTAERCSINGSPVNLAHYIREMNIDTRLPLIGNYDGKYINVSLKNIDLAHGRVEFYAPVFREVDYHFAAPVADYGKAFQQANNILPEPKVSILYNCNSILNYLHGNLEGKHTGLFGPMTFGEIAHQLVNQTRVQLKVQDIR